MDDKKVIKFDVRSVVKESYEKYDVERLLPEEILHILTGGRETELKRRIETFGVIELIKYIDTLKLTEKQKKKLELIYEFAKRLHVATYKEKSNLGSSSSAGEFFVQELKFYKNEVFLLGMLDAQNRLIAVEKMSSGTINESAIYIRELVKTSLNHLANGVILAHNHPAGSLNPSSSDIESTKRIVTAFNSINVKVIDHLIIGEDQYFSFAEKDLL